MGTDCCCATAMAADLTPAIRADKPRVAASWPAFCATSRRGAAWHTTCLLAFLQGTIVMERPAVLQ